MESIFSKETLAGLRVLANEDVISNAAYKDLLTYVFGIVGKQPGATEELLFGNENLKAIDRTVLKQMYGAIATVIVEYAKTDTTAEALGRALDESGIPTARIQLFAKLYNDNSKRLRDVASQIGFDLPNLAGVNWRLDYHIRSSNTGSANAPLYLFNFKTITGDSKAQDILFSCNREQAEDMLRTVRDATNQVERLLKAQKGK
jgi:hypothetical protein